jgi:uncharacterized membrane protein YoaK (UPF0700 family)
MSNPSPTPTPSAALSPLAKLLLMLSVTTGLVDAVSVLGLGKVFTANMIGNIVFMGFAMAGTPGFHVVPYLIAIAAFVGGALVAGRTGIAPRDQALSRWIIRSALIEAAALWTTAAIAMGFDVATQTPSTRLYAIIALTVQAMGYRNATVRQLKVPDLTTTVLTLTLTGLAADSSAAGGSNPNWPRRMAAVVAIFAGALVGALLVSSFGIAGPLVITGAVVLLATLCCTRHPDMTSPLKA